jgi:excisionase family DNA binding protein
MFMSIKNAAERIGVHPSTVRRAAVNGALRALPMNGQWITTPLWLEEYRKRRRGPGRPRKEA